MKLLKKFPWGTIAAACTVAIIILTAAIIGCGYVFSAIAAQTHNTATIFDSWWQILIFILDILLVPATAAAYFFFFKFRKEKSIPASEKSIFNSILFSKSLYGICTGVFALLFIAFTVGSSLTTKNASFINEFLGVQEYEIVQSDEGEIFNEYKSDFVNADGSFDDKAMRNYSLKVALQVATEGSVLLANNGNALPLAKNSKISFFGISSSRYLLSGAGSGQLAVSVATNFSEACRENGLSVNPKLANAYKMLSAKYGHSMTNLGITLGGNSVGDQCYVEYGINEAPWTELNKTSVGDVSSSFSEYGDAAVMIISRNDGEDGDTNYYTKECIDGNYLDLANEEVTILNELFKLKKQNIFKKTVLIINAASPMQMKHISTYLESGDLDACLWVGIGGNVSYDQIAQLLSGKANPGGKLIDTYVYDNYSAPSSVNMGDFTFATKTGLPATETYSHNDKYVAYSEGIYVGYRYYETRYEDTVLKRANVGDYDYSRTVAYPFGYGMSYTTFEQSGFKVKEVKGGYNVSVTVKNTGEREGKDVVQIYLQKPYTDYDIQNKVEKASVELVGYAKTKTLKKNEEENITVFVSDESFKSYDAYGYATYIVEAGDYYLSAGANSHDALNNILAAKKKSVADGMDYNGKSDFAKLIEIKKDDTQTYSKSTATCYTITNRFSDADPTLYEGTKEQFTNFRFLSRNDWAGTYPTPVIMDCVTQRMVNDLQYAQPVAADKRVSMPTFGKSGSAKLIDLWGRDFDDKMWKDLLDQITWEEAVIMVTTGGGTSGCVNAGAPGGLAKDGPAGIGVANKNLTNVMCFPSECTMAATFNDALIEDLGNAFGMEILHVGYTGIYGPGANIHRSAFSGRNWEYYSEDPFISGKMLSREVKGLQSRGVIVFTKHFLLNDEERNRYGVSVWANEQSIREIYLSAFEGGVAEGNMNGIMSSFNRIGAIWSGKHKGLLNEVLRNEWGFVGVVQTDAYVGTHMHRALAESVVAGNDFTMGGAFPAALDDYRNNAVVAQAVRDCCHRILYTQLHSNVMNGLSMDYKIVYHTPWWKTALAVGQIISGILAGVCIVMLAACFVVTYAIRKKKKIEIKRREASPENHEKVKYFFDVFSKPVTISAASVLSALIIAAIIIGSVYGCSGTGNPGSGPHTCTSVCEVCGGCTDFDCTEDECKDKCDCPVPCEHACAVCGLCIDANSTDSRCEEKCGADHKNTLKFEAEDNHVIRYSGALGALGAVKEPGSVETYIGGLNANTGAALKFVINSDSDCVASLIISASKRQSALLVTNSMLVTVNGEIIESKAVLPAIEQNEADWVTFAEVNLGCVKLVQGRNTIKFTVIDGQNGTGFNFDGIKLKSDVTLGWYDGVHICDDVCPICGLCTNPACTDPVCADKSICDMIKQYFDISDGEAKIEGAEVIGGTVKFGAAGQKVVYNVKAEKAAEATLFLNLKADTILTTNFLFTVKINGVEVASSFSAVAKEDFDISKIATVTLPYGHNEIEIISQTDEEVLLKGIAIGCDNELTYVDKHEFLITADCVGVSGNAYKSTENYVVMQGAAGSTINFPIKSDAAASAELIIEIASGNASAAVSELIKITVNGNAVTASAELGETGDSGFAKVSLGEITLRAGHNDIVLEALASDNASVRIRGISFKNTSAVLGFSDESTYSKIKIEAENTQLIKASYEGREYPSVGGGFNASEGAYVGGINDAGLFCPGQAKIAFKINSATAGEAHLYFGIGVSGSARASSYTVIVNGVEYKSELIWTGDGWYDWGARYFGAVNLKAGENTVEIRIDAGECINIDYFIIEGFTGISQ